MNGRRLPRDFLDLLNMPFASVNNNELFMQAPGGVNTSHGMRFSEVVVDRNPAVIQASRQYTRSVQVIFRHVRSIMDLAAVMNERAMFYANRYNMNRARVRFSYLDRQRAVGVRTFQSSSRNLLSLQNLPANLANIINMPDEEDGAQIIEEVLQNMLQSNDELDLDELECFIDLGFVAEGGAEDDENEEPSKNILKIPNRGYRLCGWICIIVHILKYFEPQDISVPEGFWTTLEYEQIPAITRRRKTKLVDHVLSNVGLLKTLCTWLNRAIGSRNKAFDVNEDGQKFLIRFPMFKLVLMNIGGSLKCAHQGLQWVDQDDKYCIYLRHNKSENHFDYVHKVHLWVHEVTGKKVSKHYRWCHGCLKMIQKRRFTEHQCGSNLKCEKCSKLFTTDIMLKQHQNVSLKLMANDDMDIGDEKDCLNCGMVCYNQVCLMYHRQLCGAYNSRTMCERCHKFFFDRDHHHCTVTRCPYCKVLYDEEYQHRCYLQREQAPEEWSIEESCMRFYAFDFESMLIPNGNDTFRHQVNFVAVQQCLTENTWQFENLDLFCDWLQQFVDKDDDVCFVAHNLKGYDGRLLFEHLVDVRGYVPDDVNMEGSKLKSLKIGNLRFADSLLHIQASLEQFPKIFGLDESLFAKGFFPYRFNTIENQNYVGPIPQPSMFEIDRMHEAKRKQFFVWYNDVKNHTYDLQSELVKYCLSDVAILAKSLEVYMEEGMNMNSGLNPMDCTTIASYAMKVYKCLHMPEHSLAVLTEDEYNFAGEAFHGGRTDVRRMMAFYSVDDVKQGKYAKYQDVQSLYPTVQFYKEMPGGIPKKFYFINDDGQVRQPQPSLDQVKTWFGFVRCDIAPTKYIHHPIVLTVGVKLLATLKPHKKVVLTTPELQYALENGYEVERIYEYHEYNRTTELFKSYIREFLKLKIESSGMPSHIKNDQDWNIYQKYHWDVLEIHLDRTKMEKNAGRKQLAKLMLNSLWGKFAERKVYSKFTKIAKENGGLFDEIENQWENGDIDMSYCEVINDTIMTVTKPKVKTVSQRRLEKTNLALATFVTAWGSLVLWEQLAKLGDRVLYHDTDSIIYENDPAGYNIPLGKYLGEWEDETGCKPIVRFVSTGPKTYSYGTMVEEFDIDDNEKVDKIVANNHDYMVDDETRRGHVIDYKCKCKGFTLDAKNAQAVNFKTMHKLLVGDIEALETYNLKFYWRLRDRKMISKTEKKVLGFQYEKGYIDKFNYTVYPYGYEQFLDLEQPRRSSSGILSQ